MRFDSSAALNQLLSAPAGNALSSCTKPMHEHTLYARFEP